MAGTITTAAAEKESTVRALDRAIDLLAVIGKAEQPIGLADVSRAASLHMTTAQRLLNVLERREFVSREQGRYRIGAAVLSLARSYLSTGGLTKSALPVLEQLVAVTGETSGIYVRQGFDRILIQRVETSNNLRFMVRVGERFSLRTGASGQVLAAALPQAELERFLKETGDVRFASGAVISREQIRARLDRVRRQGFAVSRDERNVGVASVGAPIVRPDGEVIAAVVVAGPSSRITEERVPAIAIEVQRAAAEISERFRYM